jgi:hypothetical protein
MAYIIIGDLSQAFNTRDDNDIGDDLKNVIERLSVAGNVTSLAITELRHIMNITAKHNTSIILLDGVDRFRQLSEAMMTRFHPVEFRGDTDAVFSQAETLMTQTVCKKEKQQNKKRFNQQEKRFQKKEMHLNKRNEKKQVYVHCKSHR